MKMDKTMKHQFPKHLFPKRMFARISLLAILILVMLAPPALAQSTAIMSSTWSHFQVGTLPSKVETPTK